MRTLVLTESARFSFSLLLRPSERTLEGRIREAGLVRDMVVGVLGKVPNNGDDCDDGRDVAVCRVCLEIAVLRGQEDHDDGW